MPRPRALTAPEASSTLTRPGGLLMRKHFLSWMIAAAVVSSVSLPAAAQTLPRTPDGKPDLSGIWQAVNTAAWDIQAHPAQPGVPGGPWRRRRQRDSVHAGGGGKEAGELCEPRHARPREQVLAAGRASGHLHALSVPDRPDPGPGVDPVPVRAHGAEHLHEHAAPEGPDRVVDGGLTRTLGGRHAGRGRGALQRSDVVRPGRAITTARNCTSSSATR